MASKKDLAALPSREFFKFILLTSYKVNKVFLVQFGINLQFQIKLETCKNTYS